MTPTFSSQINEDHANLYCDWKQCWGPLYFRPLTCDCRILFFYLPIECTYLWRNYDAGGCVIWTIVYHYHPLHPAGPIKYSLLQPTTVSLSIVFTLQFCMAAYPLTWPTVLLKEQFCTTTYSSLGPVSLEHNYAPLQVCPFTLLNMPFALW